MTVKHVVFGTGAIGRAIMQELLNRCQSVRMVNRSGKMAERPAGVELVAADLFDPLQVKSVTLDAEVVYHAAQPLYTEWPEKFPLLQKSIIDGLAHRGLKLVIADNLYMYGRSYGRSLTENSGNNAQTRKGLTRIALSEAALTAHREGKLSVAVGRGSDYFGPWGLNSTVMGERTFYPLLAGKPAQLIGNVDIPHTHTYTRDFGKALVILGERREADGQVWHVPNDRPEIAQREMITIITNEIGCEARMKTMGKYMLMLGSCFVPAARETLEMLYQFNEPFIVDSGKFERKFGMKATPLHDAIKETVRWYRRHPQTK